jgi:ATP-dependent DNA helicase RecG
MKNNPKISATAISKQIGIAPRNVQVHIQTLRALGTIERVGPAKGGHWVVKLPERRS